MNETLYDVIILGGGPAGYTAAIYNSRDLFKTLVIAGTSGGGQLATTTDVENYPGFPEGIQGPELMVLFKRQAERFGTLVKEENVIKITGDSKLGFSVETDQKNTYKGRSIIVATGASAKWLPLESVEKLRGKGISACATCDGFFFKDKVAAVVGGGDSAVEESDHLSKFCLKVYVIAIEKENELVARKGLQERLFNNPKIDVIYDTEIIEVFGENSVEGLKIKNNSTGEEKTLEVQGLFMAIGHKPNTDFLEGFIDLGKFGYIEPIDQTKTSKEGVFVAGDVGDWKYRQAVTAAGYGCMAALDAERFLSARPKDVTFIK